MPSYTNSSGIPLRLPWLKPTLAIPHHQYPSPYTDRILCPIPLAYARSLRESTNLRLHESRTPQCALRALLRHIQAISLMRPHSVLYHVPDRFYPAMVQTAQALLSIVLCHNFHPFPEHLLRPTTSGASVAGPDKDQSALVKMVKDAEGYASTITPSPPCR